MHDTINELRRSFPPLLKRQQALDLCGRIGISRHTFQEFCNANTPGLRLRLGSAKYHRYSRDAIITLISVANP